MDAAAAIGIVLGVAGLVLGLVQIKHMRTSSPPDATALPWVHEDKVRLLELAARDPAFDGQWRSHVDDTLEDLGDLRTILTRDERFGAARRIAARRLAETDRPSEAWFLLELALSDYDTSVAQEIGRALPKIKSVDACPVLISELASASDSGQQKRLVMLLSAFENDQARDALIEFVRGNSTAAPDAVKEAVEGVATWQDATACNFLVECLDCSLPVHSLRRTAAEALGAYLDSPKALHSLMSAVSSEDEYLRLAVVGTLAESYAPGVVEILEAALGDGCWRIRHEAFEALEKRGVRLDVPPSRGSAAQAAGWAAE